MLSCSFFVLFLFSWLAIKIHATAEISGNFNVLSILREIPRDDSLVVSSNKNFNVEDFKGLLHIVKRRAAKTEEKVTENVESITQLPFTRSNCRKLLLIMAKRLMKYLTECMKQLKMDHPAPGEFDKYFNCALRCAMGKVSMLDENGVMTVESFDVFKTKHVPERYHNVTHQVVGDCLVQHLKRVTTLDKDPQCLGLGDFFKCAQSFVGDNC